MIQIRKEENQKKQKEKKLKVYKVNTVVVKHFCNTCG